MAEKNFMNKSFILKKANTQPDGTFTVDGAVELFLRTPYGASSVATVKDVNTQNGQTTVCNCEGGVKVDERLNKQLKYFFGVDFPLDSYVNVKVSVWGTWGKALAKFNLADGDQFLFFLSSIKCESFSRKNGETGYELRANAFDFKPLRKSKTDGVQGQPAAPAPVKSAPAASQAAPAASQATPVANNTASGVDLADFNEFDDDGDLPF